MSKISVDENGKYVWEYHMDLNTNRNVFRLVMKIITFIYVFVMIVMLGIVVMTRSFNAENIMWLLKIIIPIFLFVYLLTYVSYRLYIKSLGGVYHVRFEMDENGIKHIPLEKERQYNRDIGKASLLIGALTKNLGLLGTGMYVSTLEEVYSEFSKVVGIKADRKHDLIYVNYVTLYNQVYAEPDDYDFVLNYISDHCPKAKVSEK